MANEKRLIDANALRTDYLKKHRMTDTEFDICYPWWQFSKAIENAPTVDAVEVVRCKDCKYCTYDSEDRFYACVCHDGIDDVVSGDDFCSYGERRTDDHT